MLHIATTTVHLRHTLFDGTVDMAVILQWTQ
jgi:hypothetical protein